MTASIRRQIGNHLVTLAETLAGVQVFRNLDRALDSKCFPVIAITSADDTSEPAINRRADSQADFEIHILVQDPEDPELVADALEVSLHALLFDDPRLGGLANGETPLRRVGGTWDFELGRTVDRTVIYRAGFRTQLTHLEQSA